MDFFKLCLYGYMLAIALTMFCLIFRRSSQSAAEPSAQQGQAQQLKPHSTNSAAADPSSTSPKKPRFSVWDTGEHGTPKRRTSAEESADAYV